MHPIKHFITITKHRHKVIAHCIRAGIFFQGLGHDLSKYSPTEFIPGAKYFQGHRSPNEAEREATGYSMAWMHHKGRNRHHFEYWTDYNPKTRQLEPVKMPVRYVKEMFCDRLAASKTYNGKNYTDSDPYNYFMKGKARRIIHPETSKLLEDLLYMLKTRGEDETFAYIRALREEELPPPGKGGSRKTAFTAIAVAIIAASASVGLYSAVDSVVGRADRKDSPDTPDIVAADTADIAVVPETLDEPEPEIVPAPPEPEIPGYVIHTYDKIPEKYEINVKHVTQRDKLITGCELISTKTVLEYWGKKNVDVEQMIKLMDQDKLRVTSEGVWYGRSPSQAFIGDPHQLSGFGCYPPVIKNMVDDFKYGDIITEETTGMSLEELCSEYVIQDVPPLIWATDSMVEPTDGDKWKLVGERGIITDETFVWPLNEHCLVLIGYDKDYYYLSDPLDYREVVKYSKQLVEKRYNQLGQMSLVIWADRGEPQEVSSQISAASSAPPAKNTASQTSAASSKPPAKNTSSQTSAASSIPPAMDTASQTSAASSTPPAKDTSSQASAASSTPPAKDTASQASKAVNSQ